MNKQKEFSLINESKPEGLVRASRRTLVDPRMNLFDSTKDVIKELEQFIDTYYPDYKDHEIRVSVVKKWKERFYHLIGDGDANKKIAVHLGSCPKTINFTLVSGCAYLSPFPNQWVYALRMALRYGLLLGWGVPILFGRKESTYKETAYHEAGHAVIGHWLGKTIRQMGFDFVSFEREENPLPPEVEALGILAGPLAQIKFNPSSDADIGAWGDQRNLDKYLELMKETMEPEEYEETASSLTVRCQDLLDDHWAEVEEVAEQLVFCEKYPDFQQA